MNLIVEEKIESMNGAVSVAFSIFGFGQEDDGYRTARVVISESGKRPKEQILPGLSDFHCLQVAVSYVGINLRAIAKDRDIQFDLDGVTLADYIPLSRNLREIWGE